LTDKPKTFFDNQLAAIRHLQNIFRYPYPGAVSEVISLLSSGTAKPDIAAAIFRSIARRVTDIVGKLGLKEPVGMTGGVARSHGKKPGEKTQNNTRSAF